MKKLSRICLSLLVMFSVAFSLTACGKKVVESATVSSISLSVVKGDEIDTSKAVVTAKYKKGGTKTFSGKDLEFGELDTSELGNQELSIKIVPENYTFNVTIRVVASEADVCAISQLESELLAEYHANRTNNGEYEKFEHKTEPIYVGNKNTFHFRLKAAGIGADGETLVPTVENVRTVVTVEQKIGDNNYQLLEGAELDAVVEIDTINAKFKFKETVDGTTFRIKVAAANPDTDYEESNYSFTTEVVVIDGFNVYDTIDLSVYDNFNTSAHKHLADPEYEGYEYAHDGWNPYHVQLKTRYGYSDDELNALLRDSLTLIFQDDIELTTDNVRQDFFWTEDDANYRDYEDASEDVVLGTPHNISQYALFYREVDNGEQFKVIGNYFAIDASRLPLMVSCEQNGPANYVDSANDKGMTAYTAVFRTAPTNGAIVTNPNTKVEYRNMAFIGNGEMSPDPRVSGALLLMKHDEINFYGYNTVANNFYMSYYFAYGNPDEDCTADGNYTIEDCRGFNSYSSLICLWGAETTNIINCTLKQSGGPAILACCDVDVNMYSEATVPELYRTAEKIMLPPTINLIQSTIESRVSGHEGWFTTYGAGDAVAMMSLLGQALTDQGDFADYYTPTGKTVVADTMTNGNITVPRVNIQCVIFGPGIIEYTGETKGTINVFEGEDKAAAIDKYEHYYGLGKYVGNADKTLTHAMDLEGTVESTFASGGFAGNPKYGMPVFECTETGAYRTAPAGAESQQTCIDSDGQWTGNHVNIYLPQGLGKGNMGALLGLYPTTAA